eukprot:GHUV01015199.1.p1 GENE.GHUV01015199.1~~GHUV01015199.1.p1  ORF type:complete len:183 (+),score=31.31 GHUV01015199.1:78-626(+)
MILNKRASTCAQVQCRSSAGTRAHASAVHKPVDARSAWVPSFAPCVSATAGPSQLQGSSRLVRPVSRRTVIPKAVQAPAAPAPQQAPEELSTTHYDSGGVTVSAYKEASGFSITVEASQPRDMVLHWAVNDWEAPPMEYCPEGTHKVRMNWTQIYIQLATEAAALRPTVCTNALHQRSTNQW